MLGRRLEDTTEGSLPLPYDDLRDGDIWRILDRETGEPKVVTEYPSNLTGEHWMCLAPGHMFGNLLAHTVRSHDDGTVSVRPGDGSSNSILIGEGRTDRPSWHGYIEHNVWTAC